MDWGLYANHFGAPDWVSTGITDIRAISDIFNGVDVLVVDSWLDFPLDSRIISYYSIEVRERCLLHLLIISAIGRPSYD